MKSIDKFLTFLRELSFEILTEIVEIAKTNTHDIKYLQGT